MAFQLTQSALQAARQVQKQPNIVLEIDGLDYPFGALAIRQYVRVGDPGLVTGDPQVDIFAFYVGGYNLVPNQENVITFDGTTTSIKQSLNIDKGESASISNMAIAMIDDGSITELITPGLVLDDVLQRKCRVWIGFEQTAYPDDYFIVFRGVITDVTSDSGKVTFQLNSPEDKKRSNIYKSVETRLTSAITNSQTTIPLETVANILTPVLGPDLTYDPAFEAYVKIGDEQSSELVKFTGISGLNLTGCVRGQFATTAQAWADETTVTTFYRLIDDAIPLALKFLFSGTQGNYVEDISISAFNVVGALNIPNSIYWAGKNVAEVYGINVGDYVSTTGSGFGSNNVTSRVVLEVNAITGGSYIVVDGAPFTDESPSAATMSIRSQYDTLPDGLRMGGDEVDVAEHLLLYQRFLSSDQYDIYLKETIENAKEFLEQNIYSPIACYSLPRKSKASIGYHIGPIPGQDILTLNDTNVKNPSKQKLKRSTNNQFYNEIVYKFEEDETTDRFLSNLITISATSKNRIKGANKTLVIDAKGFRDATGGESRAQLHSNRRLSRYEFGAEVITASVLFEVGFNSEIGDIVIYDGTDLKLPDTSSGERGMAPRLLEIQNKDFNLRTGDITLEMVDTSFSTAARYCLIGHSSDISAGISTTQFVIQSSYNSSFGAQEYRKWNTLTNCSVNVRNADSSILENTVIVDASTNTITVSPALSFTPTAGMIMELSSYNDVDVTQQIALVYAHQAVLTNATLDNTAYSML